MRVSGVHGMRRVLVRACAVCTMIRKLIYVVAACMELTWSPPSCLSLASEIIARDRDLEPAPRAKGIALGFVLHAGDVDTFAALL